MGARRTSTKPAAGRAGSRRAEKAAAARTEGRRAVKREGAVGKTPAKKASAPTMRPRKPAGGTARTRKGTSSASPAKTLGETKAAKKAAPRTAANEESASTISEPSSRARNRLLAWFDEHHRRYPWRETRDPYLTLVAETMLQQTQTGRVAPTYEQFVRRFPDVRALAHAPAMEVIRAWKGLGYNRRAVDLQAAAQTIDRDFSNSFPRDVDDLKSLRGVGDYTAAAVACFAFDEQVAVVDTNVRRVLARAARGREADRISLREATTLANAWLPHGHAYRWNQALMDLGAMVCRPRKPLCSKCPLKSTCLYFSKGLHKQPAEPRQAKQAPFEGSARQKRGGIIDRLRESAESGVTLAALAKGLHPHSGSNGSLEWLVTLLEGLERDGLVQLSAAARKGSPRGTARLPG